MIVLRLAIILALAGIGISLLLFLLRRDRHYLRLAGQIIKFIVVLALTYAAFVMMERVVLFRMPF